MRDQSELHFQTRRCAIQSKCGISRRSPINQSSLGPKWILTFFTRIHMRRQQKRVYLKLPQHSRRVYILINLSLFFSHWHSDLSFYSLKYNKRNIRGEAFISILYLYLSKIGPVAFYHFLSFRHEGISLSFSLMAMPRRCGAFRSVTC
jgi:hypothetical protein